jgi:RND family efflux transporter, MFP subunit
MKQRVITPIIITIAIVGFTSWKLVENKQTLDQRAEMSSYVNTVIPVTVEHPKSIELNRKFSVNGRVDAKNELTIYSKAHAVVSKKHRKAGDAVSKGTIIAQLENTVIKENLRFAEQDLAKAKKDVVRFQNLASIEAVTIRELEDTQIALRSIESHITELKDQLSNTTIVSPVSGIIDKDYFEEGTLLSIGSNVVDIVNDKALKMYVNVTEKERLILKKGDKVTIITDVYPGITFTGIIDAIAPKSNDLYYYSVELTLNSDRLTPGMYATAIFNNGESGRNIPVISRKAIVGGLKAPHVFVVRDNKAYKIPVQVGLSDNEYIEVVEGISMNDILVKSGQINLVDGIEVSIMK